MSLLAFLLMISPAQAAKCNIVAQKNPIEMTTKQMVGAWITTGWHLGASRTTPGEVFELTLTMSVFGATDQVLPASRRLQLALEDGTKIDVDGSGDVVAPVLGISGVSVISSWPIRVKPSRAQLQQLATGTLVFVQVVTDTEPFSTWDLTLATKAQQKGWAKAVEQVGCLLDMPS